MRNRFNERAEHTLTGLALYNCLALALWKKRPFKSLSDLFGFSSFKFVQSVSLLLFFSVFQFVFYMLNYNRSRNSWGKVLFTVTPILLHWHDFMLSCLTRIKKYSMFWFNKTVKFLLIILLNSQRTKNLSSETFHLQGIVWSVEHTVNNTKTGNLNKLITSLHILLKASGPGKHPVQDAK